MSIKKHTTIYLFKLKLRSKKQYIAYTRNSIAYTHMYIQPPPSRVFISLTSPIPLTSLTLSHTHSTHTHIRVQYIHTQEIFKYDRRNSVHIYTNPPNPVLFQPTPLTPRSTPSTFYTLHNNNIPLSTNTCSPKWTPTYIQLA